MEAPMKSGAVVLSLVLAGAVGCVAATATSAQAATGCRVPYLPNLSAGTFDEGAMVSGYPSDTTENAVQANVVAAGYR
jgi:hypothetical protein